MFRPAIPLVLLCMILVPAGAGEDVNLTGETGEYTLGTYAIIRFDDSSTPDEPVSLTGRNMTPSLNETRSRGEMDARRLYELRMAARDEFRRMEMNGTYELSTGLSTSAARSVPIICKQCIPQSRWKEYGYAEPAPLTSR